MKFRLLFLSSLAPAQGLFVSQNGTDVQNCGSQVLPCRTVAAALDQAASGDTVYLRGGTYRNVHYGAGDAWLMEESEKINNKKFSWTQPVLIRPYGNEKVLFQGNGDFIIQVRASEGLIFEGLEIEGEVDRIPMDSALKYQFLYKDAQGQVQRRIPEGLSLAQIQALNNLPVLDYAQRPSAYNTIGFLVQQSNHITVRNCKIHHMPGTGLRLFASDYLMVENNEVYENSRRSSVGNHGLVVEGAKSIDLVDTAKIVIQKNKVHDNYNEVYSWSENKKFVNPYIDEGKGISLQKNNAGSGWLHGRILVLNNLSWSNGFSGIHNNEGERLDIVHNSCAGNHRSGSGNNQGISTAGGDDVRIWNNAVSLSSTATGFAYSIAGTTHLDLGVNLSEGAVDPDVQNLGSWVLGSAGFTNPALGQFELTLSSMAIGKAQITQWNRDYYDQLRPLQADLGAIQSSALTALNFRQGQSLSTEGYSAKGQKIGTSPRMPQLRIFQP